MTLDEQAAALRAAASPRAATVLRLASGVAAAGGVMWSVAAHEPGLLGLPAFAVLVLGALETSRVHLRRAAAALDAGTAHVGQVTLTPHDWSDSTSWYALTEAAGETAWRFEFVPVGWRPTAGTVPAELVVDPRGPAWPVLVRTADGLVWPRGVPRPETATS